MSYKYTKTDKMMARTTPNEGSSTTSNTSTMVYEQFPYSPCLSPKCKSSQMNSRTVDACHSYLPSSGSSINSMTGVSLLGTSSTKDTMNIPCGEVDPVVQRFLRTLMSGDDEEKDFHSSSRKRNEASLAMESSADLSAPSSVAMSTSSSSSRSSLCNMTDSSFNNDSDEDEDDDELDREVAQYNSRIHDFHEDLIVPDLSCPALEGNMLRPRGYIYNKRPQQQQRHHHHHGRNNTQVGSQSQQEDDRILLDAARRTFDPTVYSRQRVSRRPLPPRPRHQEKRRRYVLKQVPLNDEEQYYYNKKKSMFSNCNDHRRYHFDQDEKRYAFYAKTSNEANTRSSMTCDSQGCFRVGRNANVQRISPENINIYNSPSLYKRLR